MFTVTQRAKQYKQPRGGFVNPKQFALIHHEDGIVLNPENISAGIVGTVVDYLTRFLSGAQKEDAFDVPISGAMRVKDFDHCYQLLESVEGLDDASIFAACQLVGYDVALRAGVMYYKPVDEIRPDADTIENIRTMVNRSLTFWKQYGPIVMDGFTFEGGYTGIISSGDGDYLTADTLWDFKVLSSAPKGIHTLQLLIYYLMGVHSVHPEFQKIRRLGMFNPRLNNVYLLDIDRIPPEVIQTVSNDVIGY